MEPKERQEAFTLVELLVVIGIIAVLMGILVPVLGKAREAARQAMCMANLHQWGEAFRIYGNQNRDFLPIDGPDGSDIGANLIGKHTPKKPTDTVSGIDDSALWYNALPAAIKQKSYYQLIVEDGQIGTNPDAKRLPTAGDTSMFVCPSAASPGTKVPLVDRVTADGGYFQVNGTDKTHPNPAPFKMYMTYGINSMLFTVGNDGKRYSVWRMSTLHPASSCILMAEKLVSPGEYKLPAQARAQPNMDTTSANTGYTNKIAQPKANWKRFTTRHRGGGFLLFSDGHVAWFAWQDLQAPPNIYNPQLIDANQPARGLIWNPAVGVGTKSTGLE